MRKILFFPVLIMVIGSLTACGGRHDFPWSEEENADEQERPVIMLDERMITSGNRSETIKTSDTVRENDSFKQLQIKDGKSVTAELETDLTGEDVVFMVIEADADIEAVVRYTYTINNDQEAEIGYYLQGSFERKTFSLKQSSEESYFSIWQEEPVVLSKGTNIFYLKGNMCSVKIKFELGQMDNPKIANIRAYTTKMN